MSNTEIKSPSRDFLIGQAVLNWVAKAFPQTSDAYGHTQVLRSVLEYSGVTIWDRAIIQDEFHQLVEKYGAQP